MDQKISKGKILIAMPVLLDPNFRQTVVLLWDHGPEGSMGLVVNRPTELEVSTVINDFPMLADAGRLYAGGPVARNALLVLCRGKAIDEGQGILKDVFLAKDLEVLKTSGLWKSDEEIRCYLGYAGWAPGQLEAEVQSGAWRLIPGDSRLIFETDPAILWQEMIRRMGGPWTVYASMPPDPSMN